MSYKQYQRVDNPIRTLISLLILPFMLTACAHLEATVTTYHSIPELASHSQKNFKSQNAKTKSFSEPISLTTMTFHILPLANQENSLEFDNHANQLNEILSTASLPNITLKRVNKLKEADIVITMDYGILNSTQELVSTPIFGAIPGNTTYHNSQMNSFGSNYSSINTTSYTPSTLGVIGNYYSTVTKYASTLLISAYDRKTVSKDNFKPIYEARVNGTTEIGNISQIVPALLRAFKETFPSENGKIQEVSVPID